MATDFNKKKSLRKALIAKKKIVSAFANELSQSQILLVFHYQGLTVGAFSKSRKVARESEVSVRVMKNKLAKIAVQGSDFELAYSLFQGPTAMMYSADPVAAAKALAQSAKDNDSVKIIGGVFEGRLIGAKEIAVLATLPSMDELRSTLVGLISSPATKLVRVLKEPSSMLARVIGAYNAQDN